MYQLEQETDETRAGEAKKRNRNCCCCMGCAGVLALLVIALLSSNFSGARALSSWMQCTNNMKQFGLAMQSYHSEYHSFPPAYTTDENGKPLHSWRVLILPYLDEQHLYSQIRLDEPWDSEYNSQFHTQMPSVYLCPQSQFKPDDGFASYNWVVGPDTISDGPNATKYSDVSARLSNTIGMIEVVRTTCWMAPANNVPQEHILPDLTFSPQTMGIGSRHPDGMNVGYLDGSVRFMKNGEASQLQEKVKIELSKPYHNWH